MPPRQLRPVDSQALRKLIEGSSISFRLTPSSFIFTCPRCQKRDKLYIRRRDGRFICFSGSCTRDAYSGRRPEVPLVPLLRMSLRELRIVLYGDEAPSSIEVEPPQFFDEDDPDLVEELVQFKELAFSYHHYPLDHKHAARGRAYLAGRGIPVDIAMAYGVRFSPIENRVIFPVYVNGQLLGWQGRLVVTNEFLDDDKGQMGYVAKIASTPALPKEHVLMFQDRLLNQDHVVLCEGPVDAIKAHLCGGNVASMGKGVSPGQLAAIRMAVKALQKAHRPRFYSGLDPDAQDEVGRLVGALEEDFECYQIEPPEGKDLGALSFEEVYDLYLSARRVDSTKLFIFLE